MTSLRQLDENVQTYWKNQCAIVIMSHTKAGYPIVQALLNIGMHVVAVTPQLKKSEMLRHGLSRQQNSRFLPKEVDLNILNSINKLILELKTEVGQVKLFLCLVPQITETEKLNIFEKDMVGLLQTILETSDLGVGAACTVASRHLISETDGHMWLIKFHHDDNDLVYDYFYYLLGLGSNAPSYLNVELINNKSRCH